MIKNTNSRRDFLKFSATAIATGLLAPTALAESKEYTAPTLKPLPPGAVSLERFKSKCTACQLCVNNCPTSVLKPAFLENGITGMMQPILKFDSESQYCDYDCMRCIEVCPNNALTKISLEEKKRTQIGKADLRFKYCIVKTELQECCECAKQCPTGAISILPWKHGLFRPKVLHLDVCNGCGKCEAICPTNKQAMFVWRNEIHEKAKSPIKTESERKNNTRKAEKGHWKNKKWISE